MPAIRDVSLRLDMEQVLRRQGMGNRARLRSQIMDLLRELLSTIDSLLKPAFAYELRSITKLHHDRLYLEGGAVLNSPLFPLVLSSARKLAAVICTIGPRLEESVTDYFARGEPLRAIMLDGIGSAAIDNLSQEACQFMKREAASLGYETSSPLSPGMDGWPVAEQRRLFRLVPAEQIGVYLTPLAVMVPRKSVSMAIGMGPEMPTWTQAETCHRCRLKGACPYRVHPNQRNETG